MTSKDQEKTVEDFILRYLKPNFEAMFWGTEERKAFNSACDDAYEDYQKDGE